MLSDKIIILSILVILFSIGSTLVNFYILNMDFIQVRSISDRVSGNPKASINLFVENDITGGTVQSLQEINKEEEK